MALECQAMNPLLAPARLMHPASHVIKYIQHAMSSCTFPTANKFLWRTFVELSFRESHFVELSFLPECSAVSYSVGLTTCC